MDTLLWDINLSALLQSFEKHGSTMHNLNKTMEAMGIEPMSASVQPTSATYLVLEYSHRFLKNREIAVTQNRDTFRLLFYDLI